MRLTVETGPLAGTQVTLDRDHPTTLGRGADCGLRIQEAGVLERHAIVKALRGEGFGLKALGAGVRVNGEQIEATPLADGDVIEIGTTRIAFGQTQQKGLPRIAGYRIQDVLGRGGMGTVYRAEQVSLNREVALKVLDHELTRNAKFTSHFIAEAQAAAKLQHPNVVAVFDVEHDGDLYYYSMELMQNGSCEQWLQQNGAMPVERALRVVADAARGLAYAESLGIVHRDIKPDNLMLDRHGVVKIADLGLAGREEEERAVGTPHFMAPEQVLRHPVDHRTDLYALGCTFYRLVTGRTPFRGQTVKDILRAQVKDEVEPPHKVEPSVPTEVSAIIQRLMAKEPADRYQTANDLLEDLEVLLQPPAKKGLWVGLAAAAVLIAGAVTWWAVNKRGETVEVTRYLDNPEAARLSKENESLRSAAREDAATIALLQARVSGLSGESLAQALDRVADEHADTRASVEARQRAAAIRRELEHQARLAEQRRKRIEAMLVGLERDIGPRLDGRDYAQALQILRDGIPEDLRGSSELIEGLGALRAKVEERARRDLGELRAAVEAAKEDPARLGPALDALAEEVSDAKRWPKALRDDLLDAKSFVATGRRDLAALLRLQRAKRWEDYRASLTGADGIAAHLGRLDFAGAAELAERFAASDASGEAGARAAGLALAARRAEEFAQALQERLSSGEVTIEDAEKRTLTVVRWDRAAGTFAVLDRRRRKPKEATLRADALRLEDWARLGRAAPDQPTGARTCFLAFLLMTRHSEAARDYLASFDPNRDDAGTGDEGYPLAADWFDLLARDLPSENDEPWVPFLRREIRAAKRLAAGLRALSERRSLAAANHLDKLLAEFEHSFVVLTLP